MATFDAGLASGYVLRLTINQNSQNYGANTTNVGWSLAIIKGSGSGKWADGPHYWSVNIGGATASGSIGSYDFRSYSTLTLGAGNTNLTHSGTGYLTAGFSGGWNDNDTWGELGDANVGGNVTFSRIPKVPAAPGSLTVAAASTTNSATLSWNVPDNMGASITGYQVQYATNSGFTTGVGTQNFTSPSNQTVTGLSAGVTYWFRVRAQNSQGYGGYSNTVSSTTLNVPNVPTGLTTGATTTSTVALSWTAPNNNGAAITSYEVQRATNSAFSAGTATQSFTGTSGQVFTGLAPGVTYWFRVRAQNSQGFGGYSSSVSETPGLPAPNLTALTQNTNADLLPVWTAPSSTTGLVGYRVEVATDAAFTENKTTHDVGITLTATISGKAGGRIYYARVAARTAGGVNVWSNTRNLMLLLSSGDLGGWTRVGTKPAAINYFTSTGLRRATSGGAQALWLESLSTGSTSLAADTFGLQRTITGLTVGKTYRYVASGTRSGVPLGDSYRLRVVSETSASPVTLGTSATSLGFVDFVADATSAVIQILLAEAVTVTGEQDSVERAAFTGMKLLELNTDYPQRLRETVLESDLATHFDLACNSVGAGWAVDAAGTTRFLLPGASLPVTAVFSDEVDAAAHSYIDVNATHDTRALTNRLVVTNYGVDATRTNEQNDELVVTSAASITEVGTRSQTLRTNLYGVAPYDTSLNARLTAILDERDQAEALISQVLLNAQQDTALFNWLEVGQRITVRRRGIEQDSQIIAITHDIQPANHRWMITLDLQPL